MAISESPAPRRLRGEDLLFWAPPVLIGSLFGLASLMASLRQGQLSVPITPDDITYFADAAGRLQVLYDHGVWSLVGDLVAQPPHSPLAFVTVFVGFLLFGLRDWAPAAVNVLWPVLLLSGVRWHLRDRPLIAFLAVAFCVLAWPLSGFLVIESRPDAVYGLLLALATVYTLGPEDSLSSSRGRSIASIAFAFAFLAKPSAIPLTVSLLAVSLVFSVLRDRSSDRSLTRERAIGRALAILGWCVLIIAPYFILSIGWVVWYIHVLTFGKEKAIWSLPISRVQHLLFYLVGSGGRAIYGWWLVPTAAVTGAAAAIRWRKGYRPGWREVGLIAVVATAYAVLTVTGHKSIYFGFILSALALFLFVAAANVLLANLEVRAFRLSVPGLALCALLFGCAVTLFHWHWYFRSAGSVRVEEPTVSYRRFAVLSSVVDALTPIGTERVNAFLPTLTPYLNAQTIRFEFMKRRVRSGHVTDLHRVATLSDHRAAIADATHVVLLDPRDRDLVSYLPSNAILGTLYSDLEADSRFRRVATVPSASGDAAVTVFGRRPPFEDIVAQSGFLPIEGPYARWNLPIVRWANHDVAEIMLRGTRSGPVALVLRAQSPIPGQEITVAIEGSEVGRCSLVQPGKPIDCSIQIPEGKERSLITLHMKSTMGAEPDHRRVLFHWIHVATVPAR